MTCETVYGKRCPRCDDLICSKSTFMLRCVTCGFDIADLEPNVMYIARQEYNLLSEEKG